MKGYVTYHSSTFNEKRKFCTYSLYYIKDDILFNANFVKRYLISSNLIYVNTSQ